LPDPLKPDETSPHVMKRRLGLGHLIDATGYSIAGFRRLLCGTLLPFARNRGPQARRASPGRTPARRFGLAACKALVFRGFFQHKVQ